MIVLPLCVIMVGCDGNADNQAQQPAVDPGPARVSQVFESYSYTLENGEVPSIRVVIGEKECVVPEEMVKGVPGVLHLGAVESLFFDSNGGTVRLQVGFAKVAGGPLVGNANFIFSAKKGFELLGLEERS
ncbi:hypothetical protein [Rubritalea halochordaticola]